MDKSYSPADIEARIYSRWEAAGWFAPTGTGAPYCIMIPPPNVTGTLHMGHAFQHTLMDALTRFHRMEGERALWQPGTDHAGIATQMVVERQLNAVGQTRQDLGREQFVERVWQWKEQSGGTISRQMRRLGDSVDWSRDRFTMDEGLSAAVAEVFVRLHERGLIYRGQRLVNWDPVLHTALSDLEVVSEPEAGHLWHLRYPLADGSGHLVVATTRPETMLGDTAVAVHPDDERYRHLVGREVRLPLVDRPIPIIADDYVDPAFGSGCVKITPAHDFNDYEIGKRHALPMINVLTADAALNDTVPAAYRGLDRFEARKRIVADLEAAGLLEKIDAHTLPVPRGDRSGAALEPWLTDQWYVRIAPLAAPAIAAVEDGRIRFVPENWAKTYFQWMRNIQDWCISRQLWWGHRIPAWYDADGHVYVARSEAAALSAAAARHGREVPLTRDEDVLDTWFSSALWPFSTLGWPRETPELATFYPTNVLVTGFDIIFFWVARMIMMGLEFRGEVPFREVYITGLIRDEHGQKMSKSKGNIIDPLDLIDGIELEALIAKRTTGLMQPQMKSAIEKATRKQFPRGIPAYGTDALRFTFAALATMGRDIRFDLGRVEGYRNFCNKLWNAARYVLMNTAEHATNLVEGDSEFTVADRWIRGRLGIAVQSVRANLAAYRFDLAAQSIYEFVWYEYCDWYLELCKPVLQSTDASPAAKRGTRRTLRRSAGGDAAHAASADAVHHRGDLAARGPARRSQRPERDARALPSRRGFPGRPGRGAPGRGVAGGRARHPPDPRRARRAALTGDSGLRADRPRGRRRGARRAGGHDRPGRQPRISQRRRVRVRIAALRDRDHRRTGDPRAVRAPGRRRVGGTRPPREAACEDRPRARQVRGETRECQLRRERTAGGRREGTRPGCGVRAPARAAR